MIFKARYSNTTSLHLASFSTLIYKLCFLSNLSQSPNYSRQKINLQSKICFPFKLYAIHLKSRLYHHAVVQRRDVLMSCSECRFVCSWVRLHQPSWHTMVCQPVLYLLPGNSWWLQNNTDHCNALDTNFDMDEVDRRCGNKTRFTIFWTRHSMVG